MKKLIFVILSAALTVNVFSKGDDISPEQFDRFLNSRTMVVLEDNPISAFNFRIKELVKKHWKVTGYEFITFSKFNEVFNNPDYSFLLLSQYQFEKDKVKPEYNYLSLWLGKENTVLLKNLPEIIGLPIAYNGADEDSYMYKLELFIRFVHQHVNLARENPDILDKNKVLKNYNKYVAEVKNKTLYVTKDDLAPEVNTLEKIHAYYPHEVKIVTPEEIKSAIEKKAKDVVILHNIGPEGSRLKYRCYNMLFGTDDAKLYYFNYHLLKNDPDVFRVKDFKRISGKGTLWFLW